MIPRQVTIIRKAKTNQPRPSETKAKPNPFLKPAEPLVPLYKPT